MSSTDKEWKDRAKRLMKSELAKRDINYVELAEKLKVIGVDESPQNLSNKIARGTFGAVFMLQVMQAIGCNNLDLQTVF